MNEMEPVVGSYLGVQLTPVADGIGPMCDAEHLMFQRLFDFFGRC